MTLKHFFLKILTFKNILKYDTPLLTVQKNDVHIITRNDMVNTVNTNKTHGILKCTEC